MCSHSWRVGSVTNMDYTALYKSLFAQNSYTSILASDGCFPVASEWQFVLIYLNNIVVFSSSPHDHICKQNKFCPFNELQKLVKIEKRELFTSTNDYMDHVVRPRRLQIATLTTDGFNDFTHHGPSTCFAILFLYAICSVDFWLALLA